MKVNLFIFDRSPEALHEDIIKDSATAIHTDADTFSLKNYSEIDARQLRTLVGVKDLRFRNHQGLLQGPCEEGGIHCD